MAKQYQFRRGTETDHLTFTGAAGELSVELTNDELRLHDGPPDLTVGGIPMLRADLSNLGQNVFTIDQLGPGDPDTFIVYNSLGQPNFEPTLDGSFILDGTLLTNRLIGGAPNTFATVDGSSNFVFVPQLSGEINFDPDSVEQSNIALNAIGGSEIQNWTILQDTLNDDSITFIKLQENAMTTEKIADLQINGDRIGLGAVTTQKIQDQTITSTDIALAGVTGQKIQNNAVTAPNFDSVTAGNSLGTRFVDDNPPPSNDFGNDGDIFYVLGNPTPLITAVSFSKGSYNEGEAGTINIIATSGGNFGQSIPYTITGISSADIDIPLTGAFVLDINANASISFLITNDISTNEGDEIMELTATGALTPATATIIDTSSDAFIGNIVISANENNFDARNAFIAIGWNGVERLEGTIIVVSGVIVGSNATTGAAFIVDNIPSGSTLSITVNGRIQGAGGNGAPHTGLNNGFPGLPGGDALNVSNTTGAIITLVNNNEIFGGGGGGGGGGAGISANGGPGGGGAGTNPGVCGEFNGSICLANPFYGTAQIGTSETFGAGGSGKGGGGNGGRGGNPGLPGVGGSNGQLGLPPGGPGAAGNAIVGIANIAITAVGDIRGAQI